MGAVDLVRKAKKTPAPEAFRLVKRASGRSLNLVRISSASGDVHSRACPKVLAKAEAIGLCKVEGVVSFAVIGRASVILVAILVA